MIGLDPSRAGGHPPAVAEAFSALAFVMSDPYVGKLTYFRVYSGTLKAGDRVLNTTPARPSASAASSDAREPPRGARPDHRGEIAAGVASRTRRRATRLG